MPSFLPTPEFTKQSKEYHLGSQIRASPHRVAAGLLTIIRSGVALIERLKKNGRLETSQEDIEILC
jgi:hypothetical protein